MQSVERSVSRRVLWTNAAEITNVAENGVVVVVVIILILIAQGLRGQFGDGLKRMLLISAFDLLMRSRDRTNLNFC